MKRCFLFLLLLVVANYSIAQCCIEAEIEGPLCSVCAPPGWAISSGTPDTGQDGIGVGGGTGCIAEFFGSPLYDGGTAALFQGGDAISTTIGGLTPGIGYVIGFEWQPIAWDCPIGGWDTNPNAQMNFTVAGSSSVLDWSGFGWDSHIVCFTASSTSVEVEIEHVLAVGICVTAVDYIPCTALETIHNCGECCELIVEIDDGAVLCPDEVFQIFGSYAFEVGTPNVYWECDPPTGLDYLDDPNSPTPNFLFPYTGDFAGQVYDFALVVEDDACTRMDNVSIEVLAIEEPEFDFLICSSGQLSDFPTESENQYTGTWSGPSDFELWAGSTASFTFSLDAGQDNCLEEQIYDLFIEETLSAEFSLADEYCSTDNNLVILPTTSDNNIEGYWDELDFTPSDLGVGDYSFIFSANNDLCFENFEFEIIITDGFTPQFTIPIELCSDELPYVFPIISDDNYDGTWLTPSIDEIFNDFEGFDNTFFPSSTDCVSEVNVQVTVELVATPSFDFETSYCQLDEVFVLNGISNEGHIGAWNPPIVDPSGSPVGELELLWTPDNPDDCIDAILMNIDIESEILYGFNQVDLFCFGEVYVFPTTSDNGLVTGTWFYPDLSSLSGSGEYTNIFFPDDMLCANEILFEFEYVDEQIPEFDLPNYLCANDDNFALPSISINNLDGSWNIDEIEVQSSIGQSVAVVFTPDDPECSTNFETTVQVLNEISIDFDVSPPTDCSSANGMIFVIDSDPSLNYSIDNGTTWQSALDFGGLAAGSYTILAQYIIAPECIQEFPALIESLDNPQVDIIAQEDNSSCIMPNGSVSFISNSTEAVEYSIDGGVTWQSESNFENLSGGLYEFIIRFVDSPSCTTLRTVDLNQPSIPIIDDIIVVPLTDCLSANGSLYIESSSSQIEYSIDGGMNWQAEPLFENLEEGNYEVMIRNIGSEDCVSEMIENIEAIEIPEILSTNFNSPTDCGEENGDIFISASGADLTYSIDGGATWNDLGSFMNLASGDFEVIITSTSMSNCELYYPFTLEAPNLPEIDMIVQTDLNGCDALMDPNNFGGKIEILTAGSNLEFSIDDGASWQTENVFEDLPTGEYEIIIRDQEAIACFIIETVTLNIVPEVMDLFPHFGTDPTECMLSDGMIEFDELVDVDLYYSINGGSDFQTSPLFENLGAGVYDLIVRLGLNEDCIFETSLELLDPDCPCGNYELMYDVFDVPCNQDVLGAIDVTLQGDEQLFWSNGFNDSNLEDLESGWYFITVTYEDGNCEHIDSIYVNEIEAIDFSITDFPSDCVEISNGGFFVENVSGGSGNYTFSIDGENFQSSNEFENLAPGVYEILVQDDEECIVIQQVEIETNTAVEVNLIEEITIQLGDTITLNPIVNTTDVDSFAWTPISGILNSNDLSISVSPIENSHYEFTVYFGACSVTSIVSILIDGMTDIYIPNVLSVDSDNNNNFYVQGSESMLIESMSIFDRWGNRVFYKDQPKVNNPLDGWIPDESLETGVYVYLIEVMRNNSVVPLVGTVTNLK